MSNLAMSAIQPKTDIHSSRVLILDFGAQYTQLIARRVRELGVYCEILPWDISNDDVRKWKPRGIILSGGPESVTDKQPPRAPQVVFELGVPVLGICYGMQTMAAQLGGRVLPSTHREFGYAEVTSVAPNRLLDGVFDRQDAQGRSVLDVWMSHGDRVESLPPGFTAVAQSGNAPLAAMVDESRRFYAVQFHPEVTHVSCARSRVASRCGASATSSTTPSSVYARRWARARCCWGSPAAWILPSSPRCCTRPSAISSCACSWITACCA
jgi:GMP synthase (glutamine-hydrolysing)